LGVRKVIDVRGWLFQVAVLHVFRDADYLLLKRWRDTLWRANEVGAPDGRAGREQNPSHVFADNGHMLRCSCVLRAEGAARHNRNLHGLEVRIADDVMFHVDMTIQRHAVGADHAIPTALVKCRAIC
jgi:hypothetical protein